MCVRTNKTLIDSEDYLRIWHERFSKLLLGGDTSSDSVFEDRSSIQNDTQALDFCKDAEL